jgi:hypothetical protein
VVRACLASIRENPACHPPINAEHMSTSTSRKSAPPN